jgi:hydrogenase expression/formation protein HypC
LRKGYSKEVAPVCLGVPMKVLSIEDDMAQVEMGGVVRQASLALVEGVRAGDYVMVHAGFAIERLDEEQAGITLALLREIEESAEEEEKARGE